MGIRRETTLDHKAIRVVHQASFPTKAEARLVDALRGAGRLAVSLVWEDSSRVVGHVAFSPVTVDDETVGVGLAPVAVLPGFRRAGIADQLIRKGLQLAQDAGYSIAVVLGDPHYYGRFGFEPAHRFGLRGEYGDGDAFQVLELRPRALSDLPSNALIKYSPEFASVDDENPEGDNGRLAGC